MYRFYRGESYTIRYTRVNPDDTADKDFEIPGLASLEIARRAYHAITEEYTAIGYRTAHACIVGPKGEVYDAA